MHPDIRVRGSAYRLSLHFNQQQVVDNHPEWRRSGNRSVPAAEGPSQGVNFTAAKRGAGRERLPLGRPEECPQGFGTQTGLPSGVSTCEKARRIRAGVRRSGASGACQGKRTSATASRAA
jgi:hypothetical protein